MEKNIQNEFISTISHEIRTPLTSIRGFSKTLLDNWEKLDEEQKKKFITIISEQSERLIKLLENVLNAAKINSNDDKIVGKQINLKTIILKTLDVVKINHKDHNFELITPKENLCVYADFDLTQQILLNLLDNACKYSNPKTNVRVITGEFEKYHFIKVQDEGIGINKEDRDKIFDKFYRAESYISSKTQGSGLGLYIAKNLSEKMEGKLEILSPYTYKGKTVQGSEFTLFLPSFEVEEILLKKVRENV